MVIAGIHPQARCCRPCFGAKILAPHPNLTSDAALYVFNPAIGRCDIQATDIPELAPLGAATQGVRQMPGTICPRCGGEKPLRKGYCYPCQRAWFEANPEKAAAYSKRNTERMRAWRETPEGKAYLAAQLAKKRLSPEEKAERSRKKAELGAVLRAASKTRAVDKRRARYAAEPELALRLRMSSAIRSALKRRKSARWLDLVGYSVADLRSHIERQFLRGMGWHNMPKWHVDHIIPLSSFKFQSGNDPEFRAAWALTNLRPVWAPENLRKHARREFLL